MTLKTVLLVVVLLLVLMAIGTSCALSQRSVGTVTLVPGATFRFPAVQGNNLEGKPFSLPADFGGEPTLVALAYFGSHQAVVETWLPAVARLTAAHPRLKFYEVPTLTEENGRVRGFIDGGMKAGIQSLAAREATITLYLDRAAFLQSIGETTDTQIHLLLVNKDGTILWRGIGAHNDAQEQSLTAVLQP
jgi:hypothetical protein